MALDVIGAGFGRTGTLSLKLALEQLGYTKCYHMLEVAEHPEHVSMWRDTARGVMPDWDLLFDGYRAAVDWPSCNTWDRQLEHYPNAKVILSRRDATQWYTSVMNTIYPSSVQWREELGETHPRAALAFEVIWDGVFDGRMDDADHVIGVYEAHNQRVIDAVPDHKLLVFEPSDGWEPLCRFLDVPVPQTPYPRTNTTRQFQERMKAR